MIIPYDTLCTTSKYGRLPFRVMAHLLRLSLTRPCDLKLRLKISPPVIHDAANLPVNSLCIHLYEWLEERTDRSAIRNVTSWREGCKKDVTWAAAAAAKPKLWNDSVYTAHGWCRSANMVALVKQQKWAWTFIPRRRMPTRRHFSYRQHLHCVRVETDTSQRPTYLHLNLSPSPA